MSLKGHSYSSQSLQIPHVASMTPGSSATAPSPGRVAGSAVRWNAHWPPGFPRGRRLAAGLRAPALPIWPFCRSCVSVPPGRTRPASTHEPRAWAPGSNWLERFWPAKLSGGDGQQLRLGALPVSLPLGTAPLNGTRQRRQGVSPLDPGARAWSSGIHPRQLGSPARRHLPAFLRRCGAVRLCHHLIPTGSRLP